MLGASGSSGSRLRDTIEGLTGWRVGVMEFNDPGGRRDERVDSGPRAARIGVALQTVGEASVACKADEVAAAAVRHKGKPRANS